MYIRAFLIKFIMITATLWIVLGLFNGIPFTNILITSVLLTGFTFVLDVYILAQIGNGFVSMADFIFAWIGISLVGSFLFPQINPMRTASLIAAIIITFGELFFHKYMEKRVFDKQSSKLKDNKTYYKGNLQTEFGEDMDIKTAVHVNKTQLYLVKTNKPRKIK